ncbi:rab11 family-interacting protein 1 isoform X1 [Amia ocellicauda]|uniref:rab11 family-interacting protein 1 isoform X1 n=1 Tax=Amia ocellicauda TaxID=2972642 RepID=UPI003464943C
MSLADQSQQWYPTNAQVTVFQARKLRVKGKHGTNDAYAIMQVAKEKFSTSVSEKTVNPVWKEEATFDLPLFSNEQKCTLYIIVMHRALVGLDKFLGQAVIDLPELHAKQGRSKTEWFELVSKDGKKDKERGEVLVNVQFTRNNMTASMFDLSVKEKPRSGIGKLKDKIRGKKKDGFSDSVSAIVPSSQVLTDSEGETESQTSSPGTKKKSKLKSLFSSKSNLHRNVSQSMSTLETLPEKNSSLSGSRSSGLNVDSPDVKKKFKFLTHKREGSTDSKTRDPFSLLRPKQSTPEQNVCINGNHVYKQEPESRTSLAGSNQSLNSIEQGSIEDLRRLRDRNNSGSSADSLKGFSLPSYRAESRERALQEQQLKRQEEEEKRAEERQAEEWRKEEARRLIEERRQHEEAERRKMEEAKKAEELKRQEEAKKSDVKVSSLLDKVMRKKDNGKKEEPENSSTPSLENNKPQVLPRKLSKEFVEVPLPKSPQSPFDDFSKHPSANSFEEIQLKPESFSTFEEPGVKGSSAPSFPSRIAKVSAVKPRLSMSPKAEIKKGPLPSLPTSPGSLANHPHSTSPPSTPSSPFGNPPSESPNLFASLHTSLAPPKARRDSRDSVSGSNENLATAGLPPSPTDKKRTTPLPPGEPQPKPQTQPPTPTSTELDNPEPNRPKPAPRSLTSKTAALSGYLHPITEVEVTGNAESSRPQKDKPSVRSPPDYDTLFQKKKHGVKGQLQWDQIVAEMGQRNREQPSVLVGQEMSVDGPDTSVVDPKLPTHHELNPEGNTGGELNNSSPETTPTVTWRRFGSNNALGSSSKSTGLTTTPDVSGKFSESTSPNSPIKDQTKPFGEKSRFSGKESEFTVKDPFDVAKISSPKEILSPSERSTTDLFSAKLKREASDKAKEAPPVKAKPKDTNRGLREKTLQDEITDTNTDTVFSRRSLYEGKDTKVLASQASFEKDVKVLMPKDNLITRETDHTNTKETKPINTLELLAKAKEKENVSVRLKPTSANANPQDVTGGLRNENIRKVPSLEEEKVDPFSKDLFSITGEQSVTDQGLQGMDKKEHLKDKKTDEWMLTADDLDKILELKDQTEPFDSLSLEKDASNSLTHFGKKPVSEKETDDLFLNSKQTSQKKVEEVSPKEDKSQHEVKSSLLREVSNKKKQAPPLPPSKEDLPKDGMSSSTLSSARTRGMKPEKDGITDKDGKMELPSTEQRLEDRFSPSSPPSSNMSHSSLLPPSPGLQKKAVSESSPKPGVGGKTLLRAWVSPSEAQPIAAQSSGEIGGGQTSGQRRPHPVKPMNSQDGQLLSSTALGGVWENMAGKAKVGNSSGNSPYSQLTQEELVSLVVKQQEELGKKDSKILELEDYIDNLLVHVMDEKPSILLAMSKTKKAM